MLTPANEEDLCAHVRAAVESRKAFLCEGSGSKRHLGPAAVAGATVMSTRNLTRITPYDAGDMVVGAQAGVRLADLQRTLGQRGQWLPIDPPYADATIGGILATNSSGPRRLGHGTIKDLLLGMRVAGATGEITKSGGRVVKNVTGYDLPKLHVGAFGSLGVIVEANFKVSPLPDVSGAIVFACAKLEDAHRLMLDVAGGSLRPNALESLDANAAALLRQTVPGLPEGALAVAGFAGTRPVFDRHVRTLEEFRSRATAMTVLEGGPAEALWAGFRDLPGKRANDIVVRVATRPHDLPALLDSLAPKTAKNITLHAGTGIARIALSAGETALPASWQTRAAERAGYAVVESAPLDLPGREHLPWAAARHALATTIKNAWDPQQLLNPGRMAL